jgi:hypothetical protein
VVWVLSLGQPIGADNRIKTDVHDARGRVHHFHPADVAPGNSLDRAEGPDEDAIVKEPRVVVVDFCVALMVVHDRVFALGVVCGC